jgi:hypothetical protein
MARRLHNFKVEGTWFPLVFTLGLDREITQLRALDRIAAEALLGAAGRISGCETEDSVQVIAPQN